MDSWLVYQKQSEPTSFFLLEAFHRPGEGNGNPLQYSYLESSMNRGTWQATVHGDKEPDTTERLSTFKNHNLKGYIVWDPSHSQAALQS